MAITMLKKMQNDTGGPHDTLPILSIDPSTKPNLADVTRYIIYYLCYHIYDRVPHFYDISTLFGFWYSVSIRRIFFQFLKSGSFWIHSCCTKCEGCLLVNRLNSTSQMAIISQANCHKSVSNRCVIKGFRGFFFCFLNCFEFSVGVGTIVTGLSQISFFLPLRLQINISLRIFDIFWPPTIYEGHLESNAHSSI